MPTHGRIQRQEINEAETPARDITISLSAKGLFALLSFGLYWGLIFSAYWGTPFLSGPFDAQDLVAVRICAALIGQGAAFAMLFALWKRLSNMGGIRILERLPLALCTVGGLPALCQALGYPLPLAPSLACLLLFGVGHAALLCRIGFLMDALTGPSMLPAIACSAFVACAVFSVATSLDGLAQAALLIALPFACCICALAARANGTIDPGEFTGCLLEECSNDKARPEFVQFCVQMLLYSIVFSLAQLLALQYQEGPQNDSFWVSIAAAGVVMLILGLLMRRYMQPSVFMWYLLPVIALGVLPICIADPGQRAICWLVVGFGFTVFDLVSFQSLSAFIKFNNLSLVRYFSIGRLANACGMVLGWLLGIALTYVYGVDQRPIGFLFIALIVVLIAAMCYFGRGDAVSTTAAEQENGEPAVAPNASTSKRPWVDVVSDISRSAGLSPREEEVFMLLSHGRTARYIGDHLFISPATAKTHIYRIYQKLDIKSQQKLIDMVEERYLTLLGENVDTGSADNQKETQASQAPPGQPRPRGVRVWGTPIEGTPGATCAPKATGTPIENAPGAPLTRNADASDDKGANT